MNSLKKLLAFACLLTAASLTATAADKPNIIFILTDDQGYGDVGCYGLQTAQTPNLDRLAEEGTRFTDFYVHPVCGPTRSALLSGRFFSRSGGWQMSEDEITFATLMKEQGYATGCIGKWDVSHRRDIPGRIPNDRGFDTYWGPLGANDSGMVDLWENRDYIGKSDDMAYLSRTYTDKAINFIKAHRDEPFLLYLAHTMMHTIIDASPEFKNSTGNGLYADTLQELDHEIGRVVQCIDDLGLAENTLIIFTSDNGPWFNDAEKQHGKQVKAGVEWSEGPEIAWGDPGPLRDGKGSTYEGGVRVPMIARWPGTIPAGRTSDALMHIVDFFPTFGNLAGFDMPQDRLIDGVDQTELLTGQSEEGARDTVFYIFGNSALAVRKGPWKYFPAGKNRGAAYAEAGSGVPELYNLESDIGETENVAAQHPEVVRELQSMLDAFDPTEDATKADKRPAPNKRPKKEVELAPVAGAAKPSAAAKPREPQAAARQSGKPAADSSVLRYAPEPPEYVFDTIPFYHGGEFHLFFLNAMLDEAGRKSGTRWSHAKTSDFVHWERLPDAVLPGDIDPNIWTGSVIEKDGTFYLFYTGKSMPDQPDPKGDQKVMLATSTDLIHFEKQPDFTFYADGEFYWNKNINGPLDPKAKIAQQTDESFRDPEVFWNEAAGEYWMLLHSRDAKTQFHNFGLYRSDDLLHWTPREPLEMSAEVHRRNIDCPDLFKLDGKWVLIFSGARYATADRIEGPYSDNRSYECNYFVPKTVVDKDGRVLTVGTVRANQGFTDEDPKTRGGPGGRSSMVREFYLGSDGRLLMRPLPEVLSAFSETVATLEDLAEQVVAGSVTPVDGGLELKGMGRVAASDVPQDFLADFTVSLAPDSTFLLRFRQGEGKFYELKLSTAEDNVVISNPWNSTESNEGFADREIRVPANRPLEVKLFMVGDMIECFVEDVASLTINAYNLNGPRLVALVPQGRAVLHDFRLRTQGETKPAAAATIATLPSVAAATAPPAASAPGKAKDILFICFDDLNAWSTVFDEDNPIQMPNLERLADRGCFFERAYCTTPACGPSRAAILSGIRPTTSGMYNNPNKLEDHHRDSVFIPQYFQQHGYQTWGVGKVLHGEPLHAGDPSRPIWQDFTKKEMVFANPKLNGPTDDRRGKNPVFDWGMMEGKLSDDITVDVAAKKLNQYTEGPLFQAVGIYSPHLPHYARPEHFASYPMESLAVPPMPADDYDDIPPIARDTVLYQRYFNKQLFDAYDAGDPDPLYKLIQSYQSAAAYGDEMLGRLLDALDATGRADDTIIVLWSDHGYHLGDKESVIKFSLWEMANHVPLIIVAPGVTTPDSRCDEAVSLLDIYPTLVELAGLPPKPDLEGQSLVPLLENPKADRAEPALTTWLRGNHSVRSEEWRYIRYKDGSEELYRDDDPWNHDNLAENPEFNTVLAEHRKWLPENETPATERK